MKHYDYEWLTKDINDSIIITLVDVKENGEFHQYNSYQAIDVIDISGNDVSIGAANVNDLSNLLTIGTMRFKSITNDEILDISFNNLYKLYENANDISLDNSKVKITNRLLRLDELNAFTIIDGTIPTENYKIISTIINKIPTDLLQTIELARDYSTMSLDEKFRALSKLNQINECRISKNNQRIF